MSPFNKHPWYWNRADIAAILAVERGLKAQLARDLHVSRAAVYNWLAGRMKSEAILLAATQCAADCVSRNRGKVIWDKNLRRFRPKSGSSKK